MIEPNCDMPWDIYLDWLQDQGNDDLRFIDLFSIATAELGLLYHNISWFEQGIQGSGGEGGYNFSPYIDANLGEKHGNGPSHEMNQWVVDSMKGNGSC